MAGYVRMAAPWETGPDAETRKRKRFVEEELLKKITTKNDLIEFHPIILSSRPDRARFYATLSYSRVSPPWREVPQKSRDPWCTDDLALRRISNPARCGPRDNFLPNLVKPRGLVRVWPVPSTDTGYHNRRAAANDRLTKFFDEWTAYNRMAFPVSVRRKTQPSVHHSQTVFRGSLINLAQGKNRRMSSSSTNSSGSEVKRGIYAFPKSCKKRNRWRDAVREVRLLLQVAQMKLPKELPRSELRIYVSSTPDLQEEREFLEEVVYPKLQEVCEEVGLNCHVVDMRRGTGVLTNDLKTFDLIKQELHCCRNVSIGPYFIMLIGHVLDDDNLPGFLDKHVYEEIRETMIKERIVGVEAFDDVYRLDSNRTPPVYIRQPIRTAEEYKSSEEVERVLFSALSLAVSVIAKKIPSNEDSHVDFYKWSAVVREVEEGFLSCYTPRADTLCFMMDVDQTKDASMDNATPIQRLRHNIFQHYKQYASLANLINFKSGKKSVTYLRSISDTIESSVTSLLKNQIRQKRYDITQQLTDGYEILQHVRVALSETENTIECTETLSEVKDIVMRDDPSPKVILIWGQSGAGKTTIASQVATSSVLWQEGHKVVFRCIGSTLRSSSLFRVLESVIKQLNFLFSLNIDVANDLNLHQTVSLFCATLQAVSAKCANLFLILDQVELLPDLDSHYLLHILNSLSDGITLLLTFQTPNNMFNILKSHKIVHTIMTKFMSESEVLKHLTDNLKAESRVVTSDQLMAGLHALPTEVTQLNTQILTHIIRWWPSHTLTELKPFSDKSSTAFIVFIESLEKELGKTFTKYALSYLACARFGLADHEILHLLSKDSDFLNEIKEEDQECISVVDGFPYQFQISRLITMMGRFVMSLHTEGEAVYHITARPLVDAISFTYLGDSFFFLVHSRLASFFMFIRRGLLLSSKDISEQRHKHLLKYHWRTLRCVPYHLCHSSINANYVWLRLKENVFFNFSWLINEIYAGCFNELLEDITYALDNVSLDPDIQYLQQMLISVRQTVTHNPLSLAAIFASQNTDKVQDKKDSVLTVMNEARSWLKQVHLQALVPVSYIPNKANRLLMADNCIFGVTDLHPIKGTDRFVLQRVRNLSVFQILKGRDVLLATINNDIISVHLLDEEHVVVATKDSSNYHVEIFNLQENKRIKTLPLGNSEMLWFDMRSLKTSYFSTSTSIKCLDLQRGNITNIMSRKMPWAASSLSVNKPEKIFTVTVSDKTRVEATSLQDVTQSKSVTLRYEPPNQYCQSLLSTKDGMYIIYVTERQAVVIDQSLFKVKNTYTCSGLPVVRAELSTSQEHILLAYANGSITCNVLLTGAQTMVAKIKPKSQGRTAAGVFYKGGNGSLDISSEDGPVETITTLVTSEDDHFLFCGTNLGHVYVIHVPTGLQLVDITTEQDAIKKTVYLTRKGHFQHLITVDVSETARLWNMRPLLKEARKILLNYIADEDLLSEEKTKLDLNRYFITYETKKNNRMFLNGPDIKGFYNVPDTEIFTDLVNLDPAFGVLNDWEATGTIVDIFNHLLALVCASELGNVILTASKDFRLAKWNLHGGRLIWSKRLPSQGKVIHKIVSVYYDQAVLLVWQARDSDGYEISVIYTREDNHKTLSRDRVLGYWMSADRTKILLLCQESQVQPSGTRLYLWDLINTNEEICTSQLPMSSGAHPKTSDFNVTLFSPHLKSGVRLVSLTDEVENVQSKYPQKQNSLDSQELNPRASPDSGVVHMAASFNNSFEGSNKNSKFSADHSVHKRNDSNTVPLHVDELQSSSDKHIAGFEASNQEQGSSGRDTNSKKNNITDSIDSSVEKPILKNVRTHLYWARTEHLKSKDAREDILDQIKVILQDKIANPFQSNVSSPSYKRKVKIQQNTTLNLKSLSNDLTKESNEEEVFIQESKKSPIVNISDVVIPLQVTSLCFVGELDILIGTQSRHLMMMRLPFFHPIHSFGQNGSQSGDDITEAFMNEVCTPHKDAITYVTTSEDLKVLISSDSGAICLWDAQSRTLTMKIELPMGQKISHMVVSKDAIVIALATNSRTISLWTPLERREIATYRTMFHVIVRGLGPDGNDIMEIFDILNIDDILMNVASRKESQLQQRREHLTNERKMNRHQTETWRMSSSLKVIDESDMQ